MKIATKKLLITLVLASAVIMPMQQAKAMPSCRSIALVAAIGVTSYILMAGVLGSLFAYANPFTNPDIDKAMRFSSSMPSSKQQQNHQAVKKDDEQKSIGKKRVRGVQSAPATLDEPENWVVTDLSALQSKLEQVALEEILNAKETCQRIMNESGKVQLLLPHGTQPAKFSINHIVQLGTDVLDELKKTIEEFSESITLVNRSGDNEFIQEANKFLSDLQIIKDGLEKIIRNEGKS